MIIGTVKGDLISIFKSGDYRVVFESTNLDEVKQKVLELLDSK